MRLPHRHGKPAPLTPKRVATRIFAAFGLFVLISVIEQSAFAPYLGWSSAPGAAIADDGDGDGDGGDSDGDGDGDGDGGDGGGDGAGSGGQGYPFPRGNPRNHDYGSFREFFRAITDQRPFRRSRPRRRVSPPAPEPPAPEPVVGVATAAYESRYVDREVIALNPSAALLARAATLGLTEAERIEANALGVAVVRFRTPRGLDAITAREALEADGDDTVELNALYEAQQSRDCSGRICSAHAAIGWPRRSGECGLGARFGLIDTAVDRTHPSLKEADIQTRRFEFEAQPVSDPSHGTAIAGLLVGDPQGDHPGLLPAGRLLAADPFFKMADGVSRTETTRLIAALDWLVADGATIIGMPLAGPRNDALDAAIDQATELGVVVVAAAGNNGPSAPPAFPAAYPAVVATTAVDENNRVYRRSNRGGYIDYAAPGVALWTADPSGGRLRSGTSFAVPFVMAAHALRENSWWFTVSRTMSGERSRLQTKDLGKEGRDSIYGWGLVQTDGAC